MIIDDAPEIARLVSLTLNAAGIETVECTDHFAALPTLVQWDTISAVIVDKLLGMYDGTSFLYWIRKEHPKIRRIMLTGATSIDVESSPAQTILIKPAAPEAIREAVRGAS